MIIGPRRLGFPSSFLGAPMPRTTVEDVEGGRSVQTIHRAYGLR
ncbi:hypothetical protein ACIBF1_05830 [Spirillospora sp. NPDC050679]